MLRCLWGSALFLAACTIGELHQLEFSYSGYEQSYRSIRPFFEKDIQQFCAMKMEEDARCQSQRLFLGMALYDVNGDGIDELFVWNANPLYCGANQCEMVILQRCEQERYCVVNRLMAHAAPRVLYYKTKGYHDIAFFDWEGGEEFSRLFKWNGTRYDFYQKMNVRGE